MQSREDSDVETDSDCGSEVKQLLKLPDTHICDVWAHNFEEEIFKLMKLAEKFNVIAMDTEFPGIISNQPQNTLSHSEEEAEYDLIRTNVEQTKLIQIGLTIADEKGNVPYPVCTWQFNFKFDIEKDRIVGQSHDLLKKAGVQFDKLKTDGVDFLDFAQYFQASGFVYNKLVKWVVFHGSSDFAYLLRLVRNQQLPPKIDDFYKQLRKYFPNIYDLKYVIRDHPTLKDVGLTKLSYEIKCDRIGPQHQAGSDSLLTLCCYFKMLEQHGETMNNFEFEESINIIFGIGKGYLKTNLNGYQNQSSYDSNYMQYYHNYLGYPQMYGAPNPQSPLNYYMNHHTSYNMQPNYLMYQQHQQHQQQHHLRY